MLTSLFIVDGPSGVGKSELQRNIESGSSHIATIHKLTTRPNRKEANHIASVEPQCITSSLFESYTEDPGFFWYVFSGHHYGFFLQEQLSRPSTGALFVIVRDIKLIARLKALAASVGSPAYAIYLSGSPEVCRDRLLNHGSLPSDVDARLERDRTLYSNERQASTLYDSIIFNSGSIDDMVSRFITFVAERTKGAPNPYKAL